MTRVAISGDKVYCEAPDGERARTRRDSKHRRACRMGEFHQQLPRSAVLMAASLAAVALLVLTIGLPLMLNEIATLEATAAVERAAFFDLSNDLWQKLMTEGEGIRVARAAAHRGRRQCELRLRLNVWCRLCSLQTRQSALAPPPPTRNANRAPTAKKANQVKLEKMAPTACLAKTAVARAS